MQPLVWNSNVFPLVGPSKPQIVEEVFYKEN